MQYWKACALLIFFVHQNVESAHAQGIFLQQGSSGFGVQGGFVASEDATGLGAAIGYSFFGRVDLALTMERATASDERIEGDLSAIGVAPSLTIHLIKTDNPKQFSIALGGGYERVFFSADVIDQNIGGIESVHADLFAIGVQFYRGRDISKKVNLFPEISFGYSVSQLIFEFIDGSSQAESEKWASSAFGMNVAIKNDSGNTLFITPSISLSGIGTNDSDFAFSLMLGYIFLTGEVLN